MAAQGRPTELSHSKFFVSKRVNSHEIEIEEVIEFSEELNPLKVENNVVRVVGSRSHMSQETLDYVSEIKAEGKEVEIVSKGSSLKFCLVAEGYADVYPRFAPTMEWDTAAGQAIAVNAGFEMVNNETQSSLQYNKENLLNPWFIVRRKN